MNNIWTRVILVAVLSLSVSRGATTINWDFGSIYVNSAGSGNELADGMAVYLFVSKGGVATDMSGLATSLVGVDLNVGSTFDYGDKVILDVSTPNILSYATPGTGNDVASVTYSLGIDQNDRLGILFINQADGVITAGKKFGAFLSTTELLPADISNVSRSFLELQYGGTVANNSLITTHTTLIPEPSTLLLASLGVFGLLRRKRPTEPLYIDGRD